MVSFKLREDDWFEEGKYLRELYPPSYETYLSRQRLKGELVRVMVEYDSKGELREALQSMPDVEHFTGKPYLQKSGLEEYIVINTTEKPGHVVLGKVMLQP